MKIIFLGVGEAGDENYANNSHLILSKTKLLLDCGYSVPQSLWRYNADQEFLDAIYISHFHADHYFGVPVLLMRMRDSGRKKPITIIVPDGGTDQMLAVMRYGYSSIPDRSGFDIHIVEASGKLEIGELTLTFAPTSHSTMNLAVRVTDGKSSVCYSGDGAPTSETDELYRDTDLLIQEALHYDKEIAGHATILQAIESAKKCNVIRLAITHIDTEERKKADEIGKKLPEFAFIPEPGDALDL